MTRSCPRSSPGSSASGSCSSSWSGWVACCARVASRAEGRTLDLDRYIARRSVLHAADARLKFLATIAFILAVSLLPVGSFVALGLAWLALVGTSLVARIGAFRTARGAFLAVPFMLAAVPLIFTRIGEPLATVDLGPLALTIGGEGLRLFATIALKSWVSVQAALLLAFTTPFHDLVEGLRRLRLPRIMVAIMSFMYRYLGVMTDEAGRMLRARAARSADPGTGRAGGSLRWRASVAGHLVGSLFLRSYERSERIHAAMLARGFEGDIRHLAGSPPSTGALVAFAIVIAALTFFEAAAHLWLPRL